MASTSSFVRLSCLAAVACLVLSVAAAFASVAGASSPAIAFVKSEAAGKHSHIWSVRPDGSHLRRLTSGRGYDYGPAWSPGRGTIAFIRNVSGDPWHHHPTVLMLMDADGAHQRRLRYSGPSITAATNALAFSPGGRYLAGGRSPNGVGGTLAVLDLWTGRSRVVGLATYGFGLRSVSWSPGGTQIVACYELGEGATGARLDVASGQVLGEYGYASIGWRPDGLVLLGCEGNIAVKRPLLTRAVRLDGSVVRTLGKDQGGAVYSPGGTRYAFVARGKHNSRAYLRYAQADGSHMHTVLVSGRDEAIVQLAWR